MRRKRRVSSNPELLCAPAPTKRAETARASPAPTNLGVVSWPARPREPPRLLGLLLVAFRPRGNIPACSTLRVALYRHGVAACIERLADSGTAVWARRGMDSGALRATAASLLRRLQSTEEGEAAEMSAEDEVAAAARSSVEAFRGVQAESVGLSGSEKDDASGAAVGKCTHSHTA